MDRQIIIAELNDQNPEASLFENLDCALIGLGRRGCNDPIAVYSQKLIYSKLAQDGFSDDEIESYFTQLMAAHVNANTPLILNDFLE
jgi:hypothetical protein